MSITIDTFPDSFQSSYRPDNWVLTSNLWLTDVPFTTTTTGVRAPSAGEITTYGVSSDDAILELSAAFGAWTPIAGQKVYIVDGLYDGVYTILEVLSTTLLHIDASNTIGAFPGNAYRYYDNLQIQATFEFTNSGSGFESETLVIRPDSSGEFSVSPHDLSQRFYNDTEFRLAVDNPSVLGMEIFDADYFITMDYDVSFEEYYSTEDGELVGTGSPVRPRDQGGLNSYKLLNSIHPRLKLDYQGNEVLNWTDTYGDYLLEDPVVSVKRWLTYAPHATGSSRWLLSDVGYLSYISSESVNLDIEVNAYDSSDSLLWTWTPISVTPIDGSGIFGMGPTQLEAEGNSMAGVSYYVLSAEIGGSQALPDVTVQVACGNATTLAWRNKLGGLDCFAFEGRKVAVTDTSRSEVSYDYNASRPFRTTSSDTYTITTKPLPRDVRYWLKELFNATETYVVSEGNLYDCIIDSDMQFMDNQAPTQEVSVTYKLGFDNRDR